MNTYNFDVNFTTGRIYGPDLLLVVNDNNSTTFKFTFDQEGRYVFKLLYPDNTIYVQDIINGELALTKGILNQEGNYKFEISLYGDDNRLTTARIKEFPVRLELVKTDEPVQADDRLPILDNLIEETNKVVESAKNGEFDGATFTPSVSEDGDLSWSNDKGKDNPPTVNIKGAKGDPGAVKMQVVDTLPQVGDTDTIYLLKKDKPGQQNLYDEYVYTETSGWEHIGDTSVDLTDYYTKEETDEKLNNKQDTLTAGDNITIENNVISASGEELPLVYLSYGFFSDRDITDNDFIGKVESLINTNLNKFGPKRIAAWADSSSAPMKYMTYNCYNSVSTLRTSYTFYGDSINVGAYYDKIMALSSTIKVNGSWVDNHYSITSCKVELVQGSKLTTPDTVLTKTNTTAYTPTSNYHPATKKYVDDSVANASGGSPNYVLIDSSTSYDWNEVTQTLNSTENQSTLVSFMKDYIAGNNPSIGIKTVRTSPSGFSNAPTYNHTCNVYVYTNDDVDYTIDLYFEYADVTSTTNKYGVGYNQITCYTIEGSYNATSNTSNIVYYGYTSYHSLSSDAYRDNTVPLGISNSTEYSVTEDYQPAHKKYVDDLPKSYTGYDATKTQVLKNVNGTLTWITEA